VTSGQSLVPDEGAASVDAAIVLQQATERLRQEKETFDQLKAQDSRSFRVRMAIGWVSVILIPAIAIFCAYVIVGDNFSSRMKEAAAATLFVDVVGLAAAVWRATAVKGAPTRLAPTTAAIDVAQLGVRET
jgi:hypothetical protein